MSHPAAEPSVSTEAEAPTRSIGEIVGDIASDLSTLVRQEIALAKTELKEEATKAGKGAGLLSGAALAGYFTLLFLSLVIMFALGNVMDLAWAALIVTALWGIAAAVLASMGRKELKTVDPKLDLTTKTLKEDAEWLKTRNG